MVSAQHPQDLEGDVCAIAPSTEAIREELGKMLSSRTFQGSPRQSKFLRYTVEQTFAGNEGRLKEYSIGIEVFDRPDSFDPRQDNLVRIQAGRLRSRLERYYQTEGASDPIRIEFPKGGYTPVFRAIASPAPEQANETAQPNSPAVLPETPPIETGVSSRVFRVNRKAALLMIAGLVVSGVSARFLRWGQTAPGVSADSSSIVVLPFLNRSDSKEEEIFSDGLTDEIIDSLGQVPGIHVVARGSAFEFKDKSIDIRKIGQMLNVRTVLEGSVRKYGDRLRITAELDDAASGYRLWSRSYDRELKDALAIQRDISQLIVDALGVQLAGTAKIDRGPSSREAATVNPVAYQDYLTGRYFWNKQTSEGIKTAIGYFERAIAEDPMYAGAYAGLAQCYALLDSSEATPTRQIVFKIKTAASRALQLDETLGQAHLDLARAFEFEYDWAAAENEYRKGLELNPGDEVAHRWYATYLMTMGRPEEALAENRKALSLDPVSPYMTLGMAGSLSNSRHYDDAIDQFRKALALEPDFGMAHRGLGMAYLQNGMHSQALSELRVASQLMPGDSSVTGYLGYANALSGKDAETRQILRDLLIRAWREPSLALAIARIYIGLGNRDQSFLWLQRVIDAQTRPTLLLKVDPIFDPIRSDPRFAALLHRMKFN